MISSFLCLGFPTPFIQISFLSIDLILKSCLFQGKMFESLSLRSAPSLIERLTCAHFETRASLSSIFVIAPSTCPFHSKALRFSFDILVSLSQHFLPWKNLQVTAHGQRKQDDRLKRIYSTQAITSLGGNRVKKSVLFLEYLKNWKISHGQIHDLCNLLENFS